MIREGEEAEVKEDSREVNKERAVGQMIACLGSVQSFELIQRKHHKEFAMDFDPVILFVFHPSSASRHPPKGTRTRHTQETIGRLVVRPKSMTSLTKYFFTVSSFIPVFIR